MMNTQLHMWNFVVAYQKIANLVEMHSLHSITNAIELQQNYRFHRHFVERKPSIETPEESNDRRTIIDAVKTMIGIHSMSVSRYRPFITDLDLAQVRLRR